MSLEPKLIADIRMAPYLFSALCLIAMKVKDRRIHKRLHDAETALKKHGFVRVNHEKVGG